MSETNSFSAAAQARRIIAVTTQAWHVAAPSPREVARRAPHGYVPQRVVRRQQRSAGLQYAW